MPREKLRPGDDFVGDDRRKLGGLFVKELCASVEVGERIVRSFQVY